jgi:MFS family permease
MNEQSVVARIGLLAAAQGLLLTNGVMLIAVNGLAGLALAPDRRLATLPVTALVFGAALSTFPASHFMRRFGRRKGFMLGTAFGALGAAVGFTANLTHSFWLLCLGTLFAGVYNAFGQYYRLAAADLASDAWKSRAISLTLGGGICGAFLGPALGKHTRDLMAPRFTASYGALFVVSLLAMGVVSLLRVPHERTFTASEHGRSLTTIARQPKFMVAVLAAAVGYGVMNLLMAATPIAMDLCGFQFSDASFVLQWHVIGMFAPSFFTGTLIKRFGVLEIVLAGLALLFGCIGIALQGVTLTHFFWALLLLGVGWNFLFVGGTTLLTETYEPNEKAKTQGLNDFLVFAAMLVSSTTSGAVVTGAGWHTLNQLALPLLLVTALAASVLRLRLRSKHVAGDQQ